MLGPVHRVPVRGLALPAADAFDTPLGRVRIDSAARATLARLRQVVTSEPAHAMEHSLEVQVPFLQKMLGEFTLVPLAVGTASITEVAETIECLWGGEETLIVISTDLSHYHSYDEARAIDGRTLARIAGFSLLSEANLIKGGTAFSSLRVAIENASARSLGRGFRFAYQPATFSAAHSGFLSEWQSLHALGMP